MYIYSKEKLKDTEIIGSKMLFTYLEEDGDAVKELTSALDERGIYYRAVGKSFESCGRNGYVADIEREISGSKIAVIALSEAFFEERNKTLQNITWYEIGCLLGQNKKVVLYFLDIPPQKVEEKLYRTPVRQIQGCHTLSDLLAFISANNIMENLFYSDTAVNQYAAKRISYIKLTAVFNIYRTNIAEMTEHLNRFSEDKPDEKTVLNMFLQEMVCGCTVLRFNRKEVLGKPFSPYIRETEILPKDFPVNFRYSRPELLEYSSADDVYATVKTEFIIPMHALLGVDFKPFVAIKKRSKFKTEQILGIIKKNYNTEDLTDRDVYIRRDEHLQRVYFLLDLEVVDGRDMDVGEKVNYLFPQ